MSQLQVTGEAKIRDIQGPVVSNSGVITALDGDASQYVRGDGTLADFPTSTGGGSSVSYYLNSSVSQGTIGGVAYRQLSKTPISGAGTDIAISSNGYVASYITDANDPALLEVPAGNFNCEFYFSVNSNSHNPYVYAELYKYDGTTFTLLGSNQAIPEYLTNGTTLSAYYFAIPVAVAALTVTDRIAIRIYVNVDGRVVTLHTENNHLCQVVTTFSKGLISLNNLTRQNQFFGTGTSGTDFAISSSTATHTFNLPVASAANTGKLSSTDWSTFNNKQATLSFTAPLVNTSNTISIPVATSIVDGYLDNADWVNFNTAYNNMIVSAAVTGTTTKTLTLTQQDAGTITASWTDDNTDAVTSVFGRTGAVIAVSGDYNTSQVTENTNLYFTDARSRSALSFAAGSGAYNSTTGVITIPTNNNQITNGSNFITLTSLSGGTGISYNNTTGVITNSAPDQTVSLSNGAGISVTGTYPSFTIASTITQYTDALARAAISLTTTGTSGAATYNSTTGVLNVPNYAPDLSGYVPTSRTLTINGTAFDLSANRSWSVGTVTSVAASAGTGISISGSPITTSGTLTITNTAPDQVVALTASTGISISGTYPNFNITNTSPSRGGTVTSVGLSSATSGVTIGSSPITTSGTITLAIVTASGSQNGLLSSTDWTTFNNKQSALTNPVTGTGTTNYLPKFTGASTIGDSVIHESAGGNIGIGNTNNTYKLDVTGNIRTSETVLVGNGAAQTELRINSLGGTNQGPFMRFQKAGSNKGYIGTYSAIISGTSDDLTYYATGSQQWMTNNSTATRMTLDASGNLGLGVTPSAWSSVHKVFQFGAVGSLETDNDAVALSNNRYFDGTNRYTTNDFASIFVQVNGQHIWYTAPSGTAGNAITFTQAMTLFSTGNLAVGTTTDAGYKLDVNGTGRFSGAVTVGGSDLFLSLSTASIVFNSAANFNTQIYQTGGSLVLYTGANPRLTIASTGAATFSSSVSAVNGLFNTASSVPSPAGITGWDNTVTIFGGNTTTSKALAIGYNTTNDAAYILSAEPTVAWRKMWFGASEYRFTISQSATPSMIITSGGNVGIGTDTIGGRLDVRAAGVSSFSYYFRNSNGGYGGGVYNTGGNNTQLYLATSAGAENVLIAASGVSWFNGGNVLIGTTTDSGEKMQVNGITKTAGLSLSGTTVSTTQTMTSSFYMWIFNGASGQTLTLYSSSGHNNTHFIKNSSANSLTLAATNIETLTSTTTVGSITIPAYKTVQVISNGGSVWLVMNQS